MPPLAYQSGCVKVLLRQCGAKKGVRLLSSKPKDKKSQAWKYDFNQSFGNNGRAHIGATNELLFGPVVKTASKPPKDQDAATDPSAVTSGEDESEVFWTEKVRDDNSRIASRQEMLTKHRQQSNFLKEIAEATAAMEVNHPGVGSTSSSEQPPSPLPAPPPAQLSPSVHPMVNVLKPKLKDPALLIETIRHTRQQQKQKISYQTPSVTKILQVTMPDKQRRVLEAWEDRMVKEMGRPAFEEMKRTTFLRGERLHAIVDRYMQSGDFDQPLSPPDTDQVTDNHVKSIMHVMDSETASCWAGHAMH